MRKQMFKIAGVKDEKSFYKKFPTEEAFMAKHGDTFKAQFGGMMSGGMDTGDIMQGVGGMSGMAGTAGQAAGGAMGAMGGYAGMLNTVGEIGDGLKAIKAGKMAMKEAQQTAKVSDIALKASMTPDVNEQAQLSNIQQQRYNAQMRPVNGEELFPINGVGTNVLAKKGAMIPKAQQGINFQPQGPGAYSSVTQPGQIGQSGTGFGDFAGGAGGAQVGRIAGNIMGNDGGSQLGGTLGKTAGTLIGGPIGGMVGEVAGKVIGGAIDTTDSRKKKADDQTAVNTQLMANIGFGKNIRAQNSGYMQNGGDVRKPASISFPFEKKDLVKVNMDKSATVKGKGTGFQGVPLETTIDTTKLYNDFDKEFYVPYLTKQTEGIPLEGFDRLSQEDKNDLFDKYYPLRKDEKGNRIYGANKDFDQNKINKSKERIIDERGQNQRISDRTFQMGGEVQGEQDIAPMWGGGLKPLSYNPNTDGGGETMMFTGASHKDGGIGVNYAGNKIEAEGGEPAMKMQNGGEGENLVIYGDLPISEQTAMMMGDLTAKGKKFKGYVNGIAKMENKANARKNKAIMIAGEDLKESYKFDRLKLDTQAIISKGSDVKLKQYSEKKENAAYAQNALNETAEEIGIDPVKLAKGGDPMDNWFKRQLNKSKELTRIPAQTAYAQHGKNVFKSEEDALKAGFEKIDGKWTKEVVPGSEGGSLGKTGGTPDIPGSKGTPGRIIKSATNKMSSEEWKAYLAKETPEKKQARYARETQQGLRELPTPDVAPIAGTPATEQFLPDIDPVNEYASIVPEEQKSRGKWDPSGLLGAISPLFGRGTDAEALDGNQLWGEMYALSHNDVEPVYAQSYKPELDVPYDISYQDQLNRNTSTFRGAQKLSNGNSAAMSMLAAQNYGADQPVLAEQFRANQAMKDKVYSGNRATLNDAKLKNLAIFDQQFVRQSQAKSNTKEAHQLALNSISDKYLRNKLEQRTLKTYENMYNYRFGKNHVAYNVNDAVNWGQRIEGALGNANSRNTGFPEGTYPVYDKDGKIGGYRYIKGEESTQTPDFNPDLQHSKYGSMTRSFKKY